MNSPIEVTERLTAIAQEYRQKGYKVFVESSVPDLPDFLRNHRPDIIAYGKEDNVVVEVKSRASLIGQVEIQELAHLVEAEQGWRFELVLVQEPSVQRVPDGSSPINVQEIESFVEAANFLKGRNLDHAALVSAWSAFEAAIRLKCEQEGIELERFAPDYLLNQAVTYGIVSRNEYHDLRDVMKYRNAFVHGFTLEGFEQKSIHFLNDFTHRLLNLQSP